MKSFDITWHDGAYYVSVPDYKGGKVYTSECVDAMDKLLAEAADYLNTHPGMDGMDLGNKITQFRLRMQAVLISPANT